MSRKCQDALYHFYFCHNIEPALTHLCYCYPFLLHTSCSWLVRRSFVTLFHTSCFTEFTSSSLPCMLLQLVSMSAGSTLSFAFDPFIDRCLITFVSLQHIRLTLARGAGRRIGAKRSSGLLLLSSITFATT